MGIVIETKKVVSVDGIASRKIIRISGVLSKEELPLEYLANGHCIYNSDGVVYMYGTDLPSMREGNWYYEDVFRKQLEYITKAGERLHGINEDIKQLVNEWKEREMFYI